MNKKLQFNFNKYHPSMKVQELKTFIIPQGAFLECFLCFIDHFR